MSEIIININEANKAQKYQDEKELFQIDAFKRVAEILKEHTVDDNKTKDITDCRFHDTIFIDGDRGVGKTAFMINIENYYKNIAKIETPKYIFLKPVDPTLLEHTEKFLSVVLARIVEYVNDNKENIEKGLEERYYKALEDLSKSLEAIKTLDKDIGIEEIASNKSSLKLEQHAHEFFKTVSEMFGKDVRAIVMLIDDVDMAFDKGFDVLEVVRKYLASPYLIPIVAGDMKLYREIVETRFIEKIKFYEDMKYLKALNCKEESLKNNSEYIKKIELLDNLVEQYLHKIFPNEYRIELKSIFTIIRENLVAVKFTDLDIPFTEIKDFEIRHLNFGINQKQFTFKVFEDNTRKVIQYLTSKKEIYSNFFRNIDYLKNAKYESYLPQKVITKYDKFIVPFMQTVDYKKSLEITYNILKESKNNDLVKFLENDLNSKYLISDRLKKLLSCMEGEDKDFVIQYKNLETVLKEKSKYFEIEDYIINLFIYNDYIKNNQHQTKNYIYSGKFIEFMIYSLFIKEEIELDEKVIQIILDKIESINFDMLIQNEDYEIYSIIFDKTSVDIDKKDSLYSVSEYFNNIKIDKDLLELSLIANNVPFNSNKIDDKADDKNEIEEEVVIDYKTAELSRTLILWKNIFANNMTLNSTTLYRILNKFYENLSYMKSQKLNDSPLEFLQRIVLIFINSVAYFENTNLKIANTNIAIGDKFDLKIALTKTNASTLNIKPLISEKLTLTKALFFHPIISHIFYPDEDSKLQSLRFVNQEEQKIVLDRIIRDEILKKIVSRNVLKTNIKKENKDKPIIEKLNNLYNIPYRKYFKNDAYKEGIKAESCYEDYLQKIIDIYNQQSSENKEISQRLLADEDRKYHKVFNLILKDMNTIHPWFRDEELVKNYQNLIYNA